MSTWRPDRPPRSERQPRPLGESLDREARRLGAPPSEVMSAVFARWPDVVGAVVADHATPQSLRHGVLTIAVDQPAWATQLRLLTSSILERLAEVGDGAAVRELRIDVRPPGR